MRGLKSSLFSLSTAWLPSLTEKRVKALKLFPVDEVWGIGRRYAAKLEALGLKSAYDFARQPDTWVRATFNNINIMRTWKELNGEDCVPNEELAKKKSICTSRSFNGMIGDLPTLRTQVANYAMRCAEKLRMQHTVASIVGVFVNTNAFREDLAQYWNYQEQRLITPTSASLTIVLGSQQYTPKEGKGKADVFANAIKHDHRSPNPTTRWSDVIKLT